MVEAPVLFRQVRLLLSHTAERQIFLSVFSNRLGWYRTDMWREVMRIRVTPLNPLLTQEGKFEIPPLKIRGGQGAL